MKQLWLTDTPLFTTSTSRLRSLKFKQTGSAKMCSFSPARAMWAVVLSALLFLPELHCENLLCYYCPLLPKGKACRPVLAECPPQELCSTASGSFGSHVALAGRGCMPEQDCHLEHTILYRGSNFTMSYSCCNWHYCNSGSRSSLHLTTIALAMAAATILLKEMC